MELVDYLLICIGGYFSLVIIMWFVNRYRNIRLFRKNFDIVEANENFSLDSMREHIQRYGELDELDINVKNLLLNQNIIKKGEKAKLFMAFDNSTIPQWIRQYAQHYFNRIVEIEG